MRRIINQTRTPIYENGRLVKYRIDTDTIEIPDPTPTPAAVRTLTTNAQACAHCHQAQTACRCASQQPHSPPRDQDDWLPRTILNARDKDTQAPPMSAEMRARRTQNDQWDTVFFKCLHHERFVGLADHLRSCTTQQLINVFVRMERGEIVKDVVDPLREAWTPKGLLGARQQ